MLPTQTCAVTLSAGPMPSEGVGGIALKDRAFIFSEWPPSAEKGVPSNYHRKKEKEGSTVLHLSLVPKFKVISFMFLFFLLLIALGTDSPAMHRRRLEASSHRSYLVHSASGSGSTNSFYRDCGRQRTEGKCVDAPHMLDYCGVTNYPVSSVYVWFGTQPMTHFAFIFWYSAAVMNVLAKRTGWRFKDEREDRQLVLWRTVSVTGAMEDSLLLYQRFTKSQCNPWSSVLNVCQHTLLLLLGFSRDVRELWKGLFTFLLFKRKKTLHRGKKKRILF